eukprot:SAG22_NODE_4053_length_1404_cov_1.580843_2_plen_135_part_00
MKELLLGDMAEQAELMGLDTQFSTQVVKAAAEFLGELAKVTKPDQKLDLLLAFTHNVDMYDTWCHDHAAGWGGHQFLAALAAEWRAVLAEDDGRLGIDAKFTRPGILCLLGQFKAKVAAMKVCAGDPPVSFEFE